MIRVGLTGGVASGKSTVSTILSELGAVVIDADVLAREVLEPGTPGLAQVSEQLGADLVGPDGALDRAALGRLVFGDETARRRLEAIVHPLVYERIAALEAETVASDPDAVVVHDIPLLVEGGPQRRAGFDAVVVVDAPEETQIARMVRERGWSEDEARSRIAAQVSRRDRLAAATHVVDNSGTREDLRDRVMEVLEDVRRAS